PRTRRGTSHERFVPGRARADRRARLRRQPHAARGRRVDAAGEGDRGGRAGIASGCVRPARRRHRSSSGRPAAGRQHRTVALARTAARAYVDTLVRLAAGASMPQVRAIAEYELASLQDAFARRGGDTEAAAHARLLAGTIEQFLSRDWSEDRLPDAPAAPPG